MRQNNHNQLLIDKEQKICIIKFCQNYSKIKHPYNIQGCLYKQVIFYLNN